MRKSLFIYFLIAIVLASCTKDKNAVPIPVEDTGFSLPVSETLELSDPQAINWTSTDISANPPAEIIQLNLDAAPGIPFYPDGFMPFIKTAPIQILDINTLPDTTINFNEIPSIPIKYRTFLIEKPEVVKAGLPKLKMNAKTALFEFGEEQGLPGSFVPTLMQDSRGIMWLATENGLCRYDGEYISKYNFLDIVFTGSVTSISQIVEDAQKRIWLKSDIKGIYVFDSRLGIVNQFAFNMGSQLNANNDFDMIMDSNGFIWSGTFTQGISIINPQDMTIRKLPYITANDKGRAKQIVEDAEGNIWVGSTTGVRILNPATGKVRMLNKSSGLPSDTITALYKDKNDKVWIGTMAKGVSIIDPIGNTMQHLTAANGLNGIVNHITNDDGNTWLASDNGVFILNPSIEKLKHLNEEKGLNDNNVKTIYTDKNSQIWISTFKGLNIINTKGFNQEYITKTDGISGTDVWSFLEDNQHRLLIGSRQGIDLYNPKTNTIQNIEKELHLTKGNNISYELLKSKNDNVLIKAPGFGIGILDASFKSIEIFKKEQGLKIIFPACFVEDKQGRIWSGGFGKQGIEITDFKNKTSTLITNKEGLIGSIVWSLIEDNDGQMWAITDSAIHILNTENKTMRYIMRNGKVLIAEGGAVLKDKDERIWVGIRKGILIADVQNKLLTTITTDNGLIAPDVYTLFAHNDIIYTGTGQGLTVFKPNKETTSTDTAQWEYTFQSFNRGQGFIYNNHNAGAAYAFQDKFWWGIEDKVLTITDQADDSQTIPNINITGITIADKPQNFYSNNWVQKNVNNTDTIWSASKDTFTLADEMPADTSWLQKNNIRWDSLTGYFNLPVNLTLPYNQNYISFQFTASQFSNRDQIRYRYFLEGYDKQWSAITKNAFSENYRDLPAGNYTFKVCTFSAGGTWSEPAIFNFSITHPWWNTWWAWIIYIAAFIIFVYGIVRYRSRYLEKENRILEEKIAHRTEQLNKKIEELKSTQAQLIQSEKMASLGELTAGIAHEIQNPLNFVNNFSEVNKELIDEMEEEMNKGNYPEVKSIAHNIKDNEEKIIFHGKRADAIVKGMLQHSRSSSGVKEPTNINALADEYLRLAYHGLRAKDKSFNAIMKTNFDETVGLISVVPQDMGRVILNLITNAFYAVTEKKSAISKDAESAYEPTVTVSTKKLQNKIEIRVKDNGNGVSQNVIEKIFQPFFTTKPTGLGTGLGLSMSYDIITNAHGGQLRVESKEGEGAEFIIQLPDKI